jgi:hypothetical protein
MKFPSTAVPACVTGVGVSAKGVQVLVAGDEANYEVLVYDGATQGEVGPAAGVRPSEVGYTHPASSKARRAASDLGPAFLPPSIHPTSK